MEGSAGVVVVIVLFLFFKRKNIRLQGYIWKEQQCDVFQTKTN